MDSNKPDPPTTGSGDAQYCRIRWSGAQEGTTGLEGSVALPDVSELSVIETLDMLQSLEGLRSWLEAQSAKLANQLSVTTATAMTDSHGINGQMWAPQLAASEMAAALRIPAGTAKTRIEHSYMLTNHQKKTLLALETGRLSWRHAVTIVEGCAGIPAAAVAGFEERLIQIGADTTVAKLAGRTRKLREKEHPVALSTRHQAALTERRVELCPAEDGMAWLSAFLPAEQAIGIHNRLTKGARTLQHPDETRTLPQLRADILSDLLTHTCLDWKGGENAVTGGEDAGAGHEASPSPESEANSSPDSDANAATTLHGIAAGNRRATISGNEAADIDEPTRTANDSAVGEPAFGPNGYLKGIHAEVLVLVPALTLLDRSDEPGELEGYGPIAPEVARELAAHAPSFTRLLTHPDTGAALSIGRDRYKIPKDLKTWLRVRDKTCRHPGCNRIAAGCEIDHTVPWSGDGISGDGNLAHLCRLHHKLKSEGFWRYNQPQPGVITAISPAGKIYTTCPEPPPDTDTSSGLNRPPF